MIYGQKLTEFQGRIHPSVMIAVYGYWVNNHSERIIKRDKQPHRHSPHKWARPESVNNGSISSASWRRSSFLSFNYKSHDAGIAKEKTQKWKRECLDALKTFEGVLLECFANMLSRYFDPSSAILKCITVRLLNHVLCKPTYFFFHSFINTMI